MSAFPNADIDAEIYMEQPTGFNTDNSVYLSQKGFIKRLLYKYDKLDIKLHITPYILGTKLTNNVLQADPKDTKRYQQEIGSLIYLTINIRPDINYQVNNLARFMTN